MNYIPYHIHTDYSLLDSCSQYTEYIDKAKEYGMTAIAFSEHGRISGWFKKMQYCKEKEIKYIHAVECYLTESLANRVRDNYHTVLIARNTNGLRELNTIISKSFDKEHFYYVNRISFDEFLNLSNNIITTSACLAGPLNKLDKSNPYYDKLIARYDYLEIQPHNDNEQKQYNIDLACISDQYNKPLIAGTDSHSVSEYKAECRKILMKYKGQSYGDEDNFDLTFKSYDELVAAFEMQGALPENIYMQAIENTNQMAALIENYDIDFSIKYPILYGSKEEDHEKFIETINKKFQDKINNGIIPTNQIEAFKAAIDEEIRVFTKTGMDGFMLSMSEILSWCHSNGIVTGPARGSVGGSRIAYILDIIDLNPETWHTIFSRFANENRIEVGDIDTDVIERDRPRIFEYIKNRFGNQQCARVSSFGTIADRAAIDEIGGALREYWNEEHPNQADDNPYSLTKIKEIKKEYSINPDETKEKYKDIFYYYDGLINTKVSQSIHPAGMVISPINLIETYGTFDKDGDNCLFLDMDECHNAGLVKYDFLCLVNVKIIKDTCDALGIEYPNSANVNWGDEKVWNDMLRSPAGIFQMESDFAFQLLSKLKPRNIFEMCYITAAIRPAGASFRDALVARQVHDNGSEIVNAILKDNLGYLLYQEDVIRFLQEICGLTASEADTMRRAIAKKNLDVIEKWLPKIIDGYCNKSTKSRAEAEEEVKQFLRVIEDASNYMFNYSHSVGYCLLGYLCAYFRYYHPVEFITALLNNAKDQDDINKFTELANVYGITITAPRFGHSKKGYSGDTNTRTISKGIASIKNISNDTADELMRIYNMNYTSFVEILNEIINHSSVKKNQLEILMKIDFFDSIGNYRELSQIYKMFELFGSMVKTRIKRETVNNEIIKSIIEKYTNITNTYYKFDDTEKVKLCMLEIEQYIKSLKLSDINYKIKVQNYIDCLGYAPATGKSTDRLILIVTDINPINGRNGQLWQYRLSAQSLGSGKTARLSVSKELYKNYPILKNSIVEAKELKKDEKGYWHLANYIVW